MVEYLIHHFLIALGAEGNRGERLGFTPGEYCRAVRSWQVVYLAPDGADFIGGAPIEPDFIVEDHAAHRLLFHRMVIAIHHHFQGGAFLLGYRSPEFVENIGKGRTAFLFRELGFRNGVGSVVAEIVHTLP